MTDALSRSPRAAHVPISATPKDPERLSRLLARDLLDLVGDRWSALVVYALHRGPLRFSELKERIDEAGPKRLGRTEISHKMLAAVLRELRRDGLIVRTDRPDGAARAEYTLSPLGQSFWVPMMAVYEWTVEHATDVADARRRFDAMNAADGE